MGSPAKSSGSGVLRIGVVGSREFGEMELVRQFIRDLHSTVTVVTGGARGVDRVAEDEARQRKLTLIVMAADWERDRKSAGVIRNQKLVEECDEIMAFWDGASRGTLDTITRARRMGKPVQVVCARCKAISARVCYATNSFQLARRIDKDSKCECPCHG